MKSLQGLCLIVLCSFSQLASPTEIAPFTSDGCSSFPEGTFEQKQLWLKCCTKHDFAYWQGGTYKQRLEADKALQRCVAAVGEEEIAILMLAGVRVGGSPYWPTEFRWGYGWPWPKDYGPLTEKEQSAVAEQILKSEKIIQELIGVQ